jgi:hypothetical protein
MPVILGLIAAGLAFIAASGGKTSLPEGEGGDSKPSKSSARKPVRKMSAQDAFEAGKKAREAEFVLESKAKAEREREIEAAVVKRMKSVKAEAPAPAETEGE